MHPDAQPFLTAVPDPEIRDRLRLFFDAYDRMDRENTHLRVLLQDRGHCPYGHFSATHGCALGYPGCACMDDLMALTAWSPEDEDKAAVRMGRLVVELRRHLDTARAALRTGADGLEKAGSTEAAEIMREVARAELKVSLQ